ncbi:MAG: hypothetical protein IIZ53_08290 [Ruminococcus sp.]|jgi:hypothetical protein|nr:hypothetical protein [Ruminococcus sp.]
MELTVLPKNNGYTVNDKNSNKNLYTVKKKTFGQKWNLLDTSKYNLYTIAQLGDEKKPAFSIILNDVTFLTIECKSQFLDPTLTAKSRTMNYSITSKDRRNFTIIFNDNIIGHINTKVGVTGELQYDIDIENRFFDDYIPLFAVAVDRTFGELNKQQ